MNRIPLKEVLGAVYAGVGLVTFGHAMVHHPLYIPMTPEAGMDISFISSIAVAAVWPLYWSVELQR